MYCNALHRRQGCPPGAMMAHEAGIETQ